MVKNESDIIESFVRINSLVLDEIHIIDDGSSDETLNILKNLKNEGYKISVHFHNLKEVQQQSKLMTNIVKDTRHLGWDYAILLDADEFLIDDRAKIEAELSNLQDKFFGLMEWQTFIPVETPNGESRTLHNSYKARPHESKNNYNYKVTIPSKLVSDELHVAVGNHGVITKKPARETHLVLKTRVAHVPVRSANQIICKSILNSHTLSIKTNRLPGESAHWYTMANAIRDNNYILGIRELQHLALGCNQAEYNEVHELLDNPKIPDIGKLKYTPDIDLDVLKAFDNYCGELCDRIRVLATDQPKPSVVETQCKGSIIKNFANWIKG